MRAPAHNKYSSKTYTERRAERARVEVEEKDVLNFFVLLVPTQLTSNTDFYQTSAKENPEQYDESGLQWQWSAVEAT